ncbi:hypothetical protein FSPOR_6786 [Fusarium sporotrichioides]|uniref:Ankyrin repeat n=1 Tax=Fusarium sporotrichioides TaxID=5514 RepID=A0A395S181_FUSSP|nr:hypothetical protein FSPOR_6786 [Fusarium sporotrichioides]
MDLSPSIELETIYYRFTDGAAERYGSADRRLHPYVTTTDEDGFILYEEEDFPLLDQIIKENDARALRQYLTNAPWAVPAAPDIPAALKGDSIGSDYFLTAACSGGLDVLQMLLAHGSEGKHHQSPTKIRFKERGYELLNEAAKWGHVEMVQFLLDHQPLYADINEHDPNGFTPIASAASFYHTRNLVPYNDIGVSASRNEAVINLLLDRGACAFDVVLPGVDVEKPPDTVLTLAVRWASSSLITTLVKRGADVLTKVTKTKWRLGFWRENSGNFEVDALFIACAIANFNAVNVLTDCLVVGFDAADIKCRRDSRGSLPIHWATQNAFADGCGQTSDEGLREVVQGITSIAEYLLDLDPASINSQDYNGNTPLHYANRAIGRHDKLYAPIFKLLCDRGGNASIRNNKGETPLHTLFKRDGIEPRYETTDDFAPVMDTAAIYTLLAHGANASDVDNDGNTPLHYAAEILHYVNAVSVLLDHGADPTVPNLKQETAVHRAACGNYRSMDYRTKAEEKTKAQENMLAMLVQVGGNICLFHYALLKVYAAGSLMPEYYDDDKGNLED